MAKTILITGCSTGIGRITAKYFQEKGWNVIATMRSPQDEEELKQLHNVLVARLDVQDSQSIASAVEAGIDRYGKIDVLVNNAGYGSFGLLEATPVEKIRRQFDVNVIGLLETTKALLPHFRKNRDGIIINISSMAGKVTFPIASLYHGSKFAVEGLSEALSFEMEAIGVKVKLVEPGLIATDFGGRSMDVNNDESLAEYQEFVAKIFKNFVNDMGKPSDPIVVAQTIFRAATDGSSQLRYIAGADAEQIIAKRKAEDDEKFLGDLKTRFGL